ncbi:MarR family transcriptional regulator [Peribacillus sp. B-H-3]|uniref:MarR family transcriptional regulator n=1 Tax=Peribacillus sp. B-H-3 TaxID=3400420 RepID=UPI003B023B53
MSREFYSKEELTESLSQSLRKFSTRTVLFQQNVAYKLGVVHTDLKTADILNETGPITAGELAKITGLSSGSVTALINRLETAGYVKREKDPEDLRRVIIVPAKERQKDIRQHYTSLSRATKEYCTRYNEEELSLLNDFIGHLSQIMHEENLKLTKGGHCRRQ